MSDDTTIIDREKLAEDNMKLVFYVLRKYYPTFAGNEEIIGCGMYGLARACNTYDPSNGASFSTYAVHCIKSEISHGIRREVRYENNKVSLETELGDSYNFHDTLVGDSDVEPVSLLDAEEFLEKLTEREKIVLEFRKLGYNDTEIGESIGLSHQRISQIRRNIKKKWEGFNNDN